MIQKYTIGQTFEYVDLFKEDLHKSDVVWILVDIVETKARVSFSSPGNSDRDREMCRFKFVINSDFVEGKYVRQNKDLNAMLL